MRPEELEEGRKLRNAAEMWSRGNNTGRAAHYPWVRWLDEHADELLALAPSPLGTRAEPPGGREDRTIRCSVCWEDVDDDGGPCGAWANCPFAEPPGGEDG